MKILSVQFSDYLDLSSPELYEDSEIEQIEYDKFKNSQKIVYYVYEFSVYRIWGRESNYICEGVCESFIPPTSKDLKKELNNAACDITGYSNSYAKNGTIHWTAYRGNLVIGSGSL